jgi:hypothetical protein
VLWRTRDWGIEREVETRSRINTLTFSPDGTYIAELGWGDAWARVWSTEYGRPMLTVVTPYSLRGASYSPDGNYLAVGSETPVLIRARTGQVVRQFGKCPKPLPTSSDSLILQEALKDYARRVEASTVSVVRYTDLPTVYKLNLLPSCLTRAYDSDQWKSVLTNLQQKNASSYALNPKFDVPFQYQLAEDLDLIGGNRNPPLGQDRFEFLREQMAKLEEQSAKHYVQVQMSAPAISNDGQTALVYIAVSYGGEFIILNKKEDSWVVERRLCSFIS